MKEKCTVSEKKMKKLGLKIAKSFGITEEEAGVLIYEELELVLSLFDEYVKVKKVYVHFIEEIDYSYRIA